MKETLLLGLSPEQKKQIKQSLIEFDKVLDLYKKVMYTKYIATEEDIVKHPDALSNYAVRTAYLNGYKAALLELLKLHSFDPHELIPKT